MKKILLSLVCFFSITICFCQTDSIIKKRERKKNILLKTSMGEIVIRLFDETPLHRDNFIRLVKTGYYDSVLFHRVIQNFMIQSGDPNSKNAEKGIPLGNGGPVKTIPAEFVPELFHKKGMVAAARTSDNVNPQKASSGSQFYIVQGRQFTDAEMDSVERVRLFGRKLPLAHRAVYKTMGGTPQLDQNYTVFGEVVRGIEIVDSIAATPTSKGKDKDRPLTDVKIIRAKLIKRK